MKTWEEDGWTISLYEALDIWGLGDCKNLPGASLSLIKHAKARIEELDVQLLLAKAKMEGRVSTLEACLSECEQQRLDLEKAISDMPARSARRIMAEQVKTIAEMEAKIEYLTECLGDS